MHCKADQLLGCPRRVIVREPWSAQQLAQAAVEQVVVRQVVGLPGVHDVHGAVHYNQAADQHLV
jgi:hypothetical protein